MRVTNLRPGDSSSIRQAAALLVKTDEQQWPSVEAALEWVERSLGKGTINRIAVNDAGRVVGWFMAEERMGNLWCYHTACVDLDYKSEDVWWHLDKDLEEQASLRGGICTKTYHQRTVTTRRTTGSLN